jgi:chromosome partitioning protein
MQTPPPKILRPTTILGLSEVADRADQKLADVRGMMLSPNSRKVPPRFTPTQLSALCGLSKDQFNRRMAKGELPRGEMVGARRHFSLAEERTWARSCHPEWQRPKGARGVVVTLAQSKGGCGKTTGAVNLAQYLALRGLRVLAIDADPQGSTTALLHPSPAAVTVDQTLLQVFTRDQPSVRFAITDTYWDGLSLIPAMSGLFAAEFFLPSRQVREPDFEFWNQLYVGLEDVREDFDVIVIDTAPSVSYININAVFASDGLVVPTPTTMLDFAAAVQFWRLFADIATTIRERKNADKVFQFIHVVLAKVDSKNAAADIVRGWINDSYPEFVLPVEIPKTAAIDVASTEFNSLYDTNVYHGSAKTYQRARDAYDRVNETVAESIVACWAAQLAAADAPQAQAA